MTRKRSSFTPEFKDELVKLYQEQRARKSLSEVARENGVGAETLRNWVKAYEKAHPQAEEPLTISEGCGSRGVTAVSAEQILVGV